MRWRKSAGLDVAGVADVAVVLVSVAPPVPLAAIRLCARAIGVPTMASPIAKIPKHTPYFFIIMILFFSLSAGALRRFFPRAVLGQRMHLSRPPSAQSNSYFLFQQSEMCS